MFLMFVFRHIIEFAVFIKILLESAAGECLWWDAADHPACSG
jgi:hypothetical protein